MPVFISHRRADTATAINVDNRLKKHGIRTCLDVLDPALQNAQNVTQQILAGLKPCTHLLAIVSGETVGSWWVPFEIGVATNADKRIASFCVSVVRLPDYLQVWPVLTRDDQLDIFAEHYLNDRWILETAHKMTEAQTTQIQTAADFHRLLKRDLGQE